MTPMFSPGTVYDLIADEMSEQIVKVASELDKIREATIKDAMELGRFSTQLDCIKDHVSRELCPDGIEKYFYDRALFLEIETFFDPSQCKLIMKSTQHFAEYPVEVSR